MHYTFSKRLKVTTFHNKCHKGRDCLVPPVKSKGTHKLMHKQKNCPELTTVIVCLKLLSMVMIMIL